VIRIFHPHFLIASALAALSLGAWVYMVAGPTGQSVEAGEVPASVDRPLADLSTRYRSQMTRAQETLRSFGYEPGPIDGIMRFETASALSAFQREHGLRVTGQANPETLAVLGIEDKLFRRRR